MPSPAAWRWAHGYQRTTIDVDVVLGPDELAKVHELLQGLGYVPAFSGSRSLRDTATGVRIEFLIAGNFPGDGKPKPVAFPNPADISIERDGIQYVNLPTLIELKLASGMSAPHRLKDLADVQELIKVLGIGREMADELNPYVRAKFAELWDAVKSAPREGLNPPVYAYRRLGV